MVEGGSRARLPAEALHGIGIFGELGGEKLQGHVPAQGKVFSLVQNAHAAAPQLVEDAKMAEDLSRLSGIDHLRKMLG